MGDKTERLKTMGGEHTKHLNIRISEELQARLKAAVATPAGSPPVDAAPVARWLLDVFCEFTEVNKRRPNDFAELAQWYLKRPKKKSET